jgi:hypothetical protein
VEIETEIFKFYHEKLYVGSNNINKNTKYHVLGTVSKSNRKMKHKTSIEHNMCWTPLYASKVKECIYKTWFLLQTIAVKDEPNIVSMWKWKPISQHATQNVKTHNRKHTNLY